MNFKQFLIIPKKLLPLRDEAKVYCVLFAVGISAIGFMDSEFDVWGCFDSIT